MKSWRISWFSLQKELALAEHFPSRQRTKENYLLRKSTGLMTKGWAQDEWSTIIVFRCAILTETYLWPETCDCSQLCINYDLRKLKRFNSFTLLCRHLFSLWQYIIQLFSEQFNTLKGGECFVYALQNIFVLRDSYCMYCSVSLFF